MIKRKKKRTAQLNIQNPSNINNDSSLENNQQITQNSSNITQNLDNQKDPQNFNDLKDSSKQNLCSTCGQNKTYYQLNNKFYCHQCKKYD